MSANCEYVRQHYNVPACIGRRVVANGKPGTIVEDRGHYIGVMLDGERRVGSHHPTWEMQYGEMADKIPKRRGAPIGTSSTTNLNAMKASLTSWASTSPSSSSGLRMIWCAWFVTTAAPSTVATQSVSARSSTAPMMTSKWPASGCPPRAKQRPATRLRCMPAKENSNA